MTSQTTWPSYASSITINTIPRPVSRSLFKSAKSKLIGNNCISFSIAAIKTPNLQGRHVAWTINVGDHIVSHREIAEGSYLESNNNRYKLVVQGDGNLVIYEGAIPVWATGTDGKGVPPFKLAMQGDGNLVMYDGNGKPTWASNTNGKGRGPFRLTMQDDRNLVIYDSQGKSTWALNTSL